MKKYWTNLRSVQIGQKQENIEQFALNTWSENKPKVLILKGYLKWRSTELICAQYKNKRPLGSSILQIFKEYNKTEQSAQLNYYPWMWQEIETKGCL